MPRRGRRWRALGLALALLASACSDGGGDDDDDADDRPAVGVGATETNDPAVEGGRLVVGLASVPDTFDPTASELSPDGLSAALAVFDPLMATSADGDVVPYLAESLDADDEHRVWRLVLRDGVTFSDGTPLTSGAVVGTFERHLASELTRQLLRDIESVSAVDARTVEVRMKRPWATFPAVLTGRLGLVPSPTMQAEPIGTGPFVVQEWLPGATVLLARSPTYWRSNEGLPHLDELELRAVPDERDRVALLGRGSIDAAQLVEPAGVDALADLDDDAIALAIDDDVRLAAYSIVFNTAVAPFDDVECRRAVAAALDREDIADAVGGAVLVPDEVDVDAPQDVSCDFTYRTGSSALDDAVGAQVRATLEEADIGVTLAPSDDGGLQLDGLLGRFEALGRFDRSATDDAERFAALDAANAAAVGTLARNIGRFDDPELQEALLAARAADDESLDARVAELIAEHLPYVTLFRVPWTFAFDASVGGIRRGLTLPGGDAALAPPGTLLPADLRRTERP